MVKHAKAEQVTVDLHFTDQACWMTIQDDGIGFEPVTAQGGGLGLRSIAERIKQLDGTLLVENLPSGGTTLQVMVKTHLAAALPQVADRLRVKGMSTQALREQRMGSPTNK